jgi:hypothetical protein
MSSSASQQPKELKNVEVRFAVAYNTAWGESVLVTGSRGLLGAGDVRKAVKLECVQAQAGLSWVGSLKVPPGYACTYRYVVFNEEQGKIVAEERDLHDLYASRKLAGRCMMLSDQFKVRHCSCASSLPFLMSVLLAFVTLHLAAS